MKQKLTEQQLKELETLSNMRDEDIDYSDIPPLTDDFFEKAVRNPFYKPVKKPVTIRLDADIIAWFKSQDGKYQSHINEALREYIEEKVKGNAA